MQASFNGFHPCESSEPDARFDPHLWKMLAARLLARSGEGLVLCDGELEVLFATPRALHLLARLGGDPSDRLPTTIASIVTDQLRSHDVTRIDRIPTLGGGSAVEVHVDLLCAPPPGRISILLREEVLRDEELFLALKENFSISRRGFQLAQLVRKGLTNRQIAEHLGLTEATVKVYLHQLYRDCRVSSRTSLVALLERCSRR